MVYLSILVCPVSWCPCAVNNRDGISHVGQAGLELLTSGDPPAVASQCAGIRGMSHCSWTIVNILSFVGHI
ncbi:hypothetical protein AAY473_034167 [Plecturocebus cupreus]